MNPPVPTRNLWPVAIILTFVIFISGTVGLIVFACSQKTELVSADYYERELRFQGEIDRIGRTRRLQPAPTITIDSTSHRVRIALPPAHAASEARGSVRFYRPSAAGLDREMPLAVDTNGVQWIDARDLQAGLWKARVAWVSGGEEFLLDQVLTNAPVPMPGALPL